MKIKDLLIPKKYKPDLMVDNKVIVELKATKLRIGLLLNFDTKSCTYSILCGYLHIKPRDYTRLTQKSCGNLCNLVVPTQGTRACSKSLEIKRRIL
jgi:hypothetical protein